MSPPLTGIYLSVPMLVTRSRSRPAYTPVLEPGTKQKRSNLEQGNSSPLQRYVETLHDPKFGFWTAVHNPS